jgi:hypothetical protein
MRETIEGQERTIRGGGERELPVGESDPTTQHRVPDPKTGKPPTPSPGLVPKSFDRGNFVHRFVRFILERRLRLPPGAQQEVRVQLDPITKDRIYIDLLVRGAGRQKGRVIEIRPRGRPAQEMKGKLPGRTQAVQKEFPNPMGYSSKVVTYTRQDVLRWLTDGEGLSHSDAIEIMRLFGFNVRGL